MQFSNKTMLSFTQLELLPWFEEHEGELKNLPWPAQSPDLKITEPLRSVLETRVNNSYRPAFTHIRILA
jgi:hypothetical protein